MPADGENATPPSTSSTNTTTTFSCNVSLPPELEVRCVNLSKEWKQWQQVWDAYEEVTESRKKTSRLRVATFITSFGKEALKVHNGLPFQSDEEKSRHKTKCWSYEQIIASGKQTSSTKDANLTTACRNRKNRSTLSSPHSEHSPNLATLEL